MFCSENNLGEGRHRLVASLSVRHISPNSKKKKDFLIISLKFPAHFLFPPQAELILSLCPFAHQKMNDNFSRAIVNLYGNKSTKLV